MLFGAVTRKRTNRFRGLVDKDFIPDHGIRGPGMSWNFIAVLDIFMKLYENIKYFIFFHGNYYCTIILFGLFSAFKEMYFLV